MTGPPTYAKNTKCQEVLLMEEILHHLGCVKPCIQWDKLPITWCRISSINSMTGGLGNITRSCCCCCWCSVAGVTLAMPPSNSHRQDHCVGSRFCIPNYQLEDGPPTRYKWGEITPNHNKWPYNWVAGVISPYL